MESIPAAAQREVSNFEIEPSITLVETPGLVWKTTMAMMASQGGWGKFAN